MISKSIKYLKIGIIVSKVVFFNIFKIKNKFTKGFENKKYILKIWSTFSNFCSKSTL